MVCNFCLTISCFFGTIFVFLAALKLFLKLTTGWCKSKTCLVGKTAIVTGANTGIGYQTALDFAMRGAKVILACRDHSKAEKARDQIIRETGNDNVAVKLIDMACLQSVRNFAEDINQTEERLDILVNNAGVGFIGDKRSEDGHVLVMQINYFSTFLLTHLLIDLLMKSGSSRIVNVSSFAANQAKQFDVDRLDHSPVEDFTVYANSKLCTIMFTRELAKRLRGTGVTSYSLHPGVVRTDFFRHFNRFFKQFMDAVVVSFFKTCEEGAQTTIYTGVARGIESFSGEHFHDCKRVEPYQTVAPGIEKKLWERSVDVLKIKLEEIRI